ncbi:hypothetical protein [uncultured Oscillibacter sp.]|uniref:hypothetical protein n=1 Tax=uncultured Oscillibacter sp. TaxID=876091 RepID=UPI002729A8DD|nr:hypothetical protein [uncultured Oscillibacter sp.]
MEEKQHEIDRRIEAAVRSAIEAGITDIEEKIRAAIKVGVEVGAAAAAEAAYATASKIAARERRKLQSQRKDKRYHDIKLLVRKYRQLNAYYENAVYDEESAAEVDEDLEEIMNIFGQKYRDEDRNLTSDSIRRGYIVSRIIMAHVNKMLEVYEVMCQHTHRAEDKRRWRVLHDLYLAEEPSTAEQIASREKIDRRTVYKDIDACLSDLSVLFFGIDGLDQAFP